MTLNKELLHNLKVNPLFQLSTGSKELFHSNFLYWLSIQYHEKCGILFKKLSNVNDLGMFIKCKREEKHVDLIFEYENRSINIENKIKSIPSKVQLDRYSCKLQENDVFLFLGLVEPSFFNKGKYIVQKENGKNIVWKFIGYEKLAVKMKDILPGCSLYVNSYIDFIDTFSKIGKKFKVNLDEPFNYFKTEILKPYQELRIHDLYLKRKYQGIGELIKKRLGINVIWKNSTGWFQPVKYNKSLLECSYNNGKGTLTLAHRMDKKWFIGIQLEGEQYRHFLMYIDFEKKLAGLSEQDKIIEIATKMNEEKVWFDSKLKIRWNLNALGDGRKKKGFNQYFTKRKDYQELFLYRYVKLEKKEEKSVEIKEIVDSFENDYSYLVEKCEMILKEYLI